VSNSTGFYSRIQVDTTNSRTPDMARKSLTPYGLSHHIGSPEIGGPKPSRSPFVIRDARAYRNR
jgi:hypothetical protein